MTKHRRIPDHIVTGWKQDHAESHLLARIGLPDEDYDKWELARLDTREQREQTNH